MSKFMSFDASVRNVFKDDEANYKDFQKLMRDAANKNVEGYSEKEANEKISAIFLKVIGCDKNSSRREIRKAIRRNQVAIYDLLEETIDDLLVSGWDDDPFMREWVEVRNLALGDKNEFYVEDSSVLSVMRVSGNHHDIIRQRLGRGKAFTVETSWLAIKVYAEYERIATGIESMAQFSIKITEAFNQYLNQAIYDALMEVGETLGTQFYKTSALDDTTKETLRTLCMDVSIATGQPVAILGTRVALGSVFDLTGVDWFSNDMKNEMYTTGKMAYFEGIPLVEIKQGFKKNDTTQYLISNTTLFIMPISAEKMIKLVYEGDTQMYTIHDPDTNVDLTESTEVLEKIGIGIVTNQKFGIWEIVA
ncbi:MAG: hypothetical protein LUB59_03730 [Candidatus Gastranaerophilales bacterium]|nr:hypothetical protein [Candidatus Gastranaerophilales bacterium]